VSLAKQAYRDFGKITHTDITPALPAADGTGVSINLTPEENAS
jgi:hypothetical protein